MQCKLKITKVYDLMISNLVNEVKRIFFKKIENKEDLNLGKYEEEFDYHYALVKARLLSYKLLIFASSASLNIHIYQLF